VPLLVAGEFHRRRDIEGGAGDVHGRLNDDRGRGDCQAGGILQFDSRFLRRRPFNRAAPVRKRWVFGGSSGLILGRGLKSPGFDLPGRFSRVVLVKLIQAPLKFSHVLRDALKFPAKRVDLLFKGRPCHARGSRSDMHGIATGSRDGVNARLTLVLA